jgi:hypothetical protein
MLSWRDPGRLPPDMALGQRWGRLRIVGYEAVQEGTRTRRHVVCVCLCGAMTTVRPGALRRRGRPTDSCGCRQREIVAAMWRAVRAGERTVHLGRKRHQREAA